MSNGSAKINNVAAATIRICRYVAGALAGATLAVGVAEAETRSLKEIRHHGVVIQQWDTSCAAAALATVMTFGFDDPVGEREVARGLLRQTEPLKVRHRGGFSMLDMKRFAEDRGYHATGFNGMRLEDLRYFHTPIVPVNFRGYNHYVVLKGVQPDGKLWIADPAFGNRIVRRESFETAWIGGIAFVLRK